jgi:hypothetical protein
VSAARLIAARSTLLGVLHRLHLTSSQGKPPLIACPMVGDGCAGPAVAPHPFVPALAREVVGFTDQRFADTPFFL